MRAVSVVRRHVRGGVPICLGRSRGILFRSPWRVGTRRALRTDSARALEAVCRTARWPLVTAPDAREVVAGMSPTADLTGRSETGQWSRSRGSSRKPSADGAYVRNYRKNLRVRCDLLHNSFPKVVNHLTLRDLVRRHAPVNARAGRTAGRVPMSRFCVLWPVPILCLSDFDGRARQTPSL